MVMKLVQNESKYWDFIRRVRNDPEIQTGFVEKVNITPEQQAKYMAKYNDGYFICLSDEQPIGFIGEVEDDIRVAVIQEFQKRGVGKFMVNEFMKLRPNSYAKMKHDNIASKKLFESCGFVYVKMDEEFFYYEKK
jgi:RimJ/RimL family protein N-acetyltransferase